jgi:DNA-binding MarR family transcriptional regulator
MMIVFHYKVAYASIVATIICMNTKTLALPTLAAPRRQGCTNLKLRQLTRRITQYYDAELGRCGLRTTQYSLLSHVLKLGPIRLGDLAHAMKMDASTLSRNLKPLLLAQWVQLAPGFDGRSRLISISDSGRAKRQDAQRHWKAAQTSLNRLFGMPRMLALHTLIDESLELLLNRSMGDSDE